MPLPSWRTGTTAQAVHGCKATSSCRSSRPSVCHATGSNLMSARPVAVRHGERSAQAFVFFLPRSCRGVHFIVPWLVVDFRFDVWFGTRGNRAGSEVRRRVGRCFAARVRRIRASWFVSGWKALRGQIWSIVRPSSLRGRRGRAVSKVPRLFFRQSLGMRINAVHQFLKNLAH